MRRRMLWTIAVPADIQLSNSLTTDYHFKPGEPITNFFSKGKTLVTAKRILEILIEGTDTKSFAPFVIHRTIMVDEQTEQGYVLHLHHGAFKSLPLHVADAADLELCGD